VKKGVVSLLLVLIVVISLSAAALSAETTQVVIKVSDPLASYMQMRLKELGYYQEPYTNTFDETTRSAVTLFRSVNNLTTENASWSVDVPLLLLLFNDSNVHTREIHSKSTIAPTPFPTLPAQTPPYQSILRNGSTGDNVKYMQIKLNDLDYYFGSINGVFDDETKYAVVAFQKKNSLDADGVVGKQTWNRLFFEKHYADWETPPATPTPFPKARYGSYNYKEMARYPEKHKGEEVLINGKVVQVLGSRSDGYQLRVAVNSNSSNIVYVYVTKDPGFGILDDDLVRIYGKARDQITYESIWGQSITIPCVNADLIELRSK
jgi:peptidoglycan hydrolase-like protein with peptidoglycan-binding domain